MFSCTSRVEWLKNAVRRSVVGRCRAQIPAENMLIIKATDRFKANVIGHGHWKTVTIGYL